MDKAEKWHGLPVPHGTTVPPLFFVGHGQLMLRGTAVPLILFDPPSFFVAHGQLVLSGTTVPPILFGPPVQTGTGPKTENGNSLDRGSDRNDPSGPVWSGPILNRITYTPSHFGACRLSLTHHHFQTPHFDWTPFRPHCCLCLC